jgi:predicted choloylglycine hydrolase
VGRNGGVNQEGLVIGSAAMWYLNKPKPGLRFHLVQRWVLDSCSDTRDAVDFLERIPHHEAMSFLVTDREGRIARIDAAPEGVAVVWVDDGIPSAFNMFESEQMQHLAHVPDQEFLFDRH